MVTLHECEDAVATTDPVMLNLKITQLYHRIALDLTVLLGAQDVNWFGFACRASKTAGSAIRGEDVPMLRPVARFVARRLPATTVDRMQRWRIVRQVDAALAAVSDAHRRREPPHLLGDRPGVRAAGRRVCRSPCRTIATTLEALVATLTPGRAEDGGQDLLGEAVTRLL